MKKITVPAGTSAIGKQAFAKCKMNTAGPIGGGYDYEFEFPCCVGIHGIVSTHVETVVLMSRDK